MDTFFETIENRGFNNLGCVMLEKDMIEAMKKIESSGDDNKIRYVKKLASYYSIFYNIRFLLGKTEIRFKGKNDKYGVEHFYHYLDNSTDSTMRIIPGVIKAMANDKPLEYFLKYLMFPNQYPLEEKEEKEEKEQVNKILENFGNFTEFIPKRI